jgi:hypothetical protein
MDSITPHLAVVHGCQAAPPTQRTELKGATGGRLYAGRPLHGVLSSSASREREGQFLRCLNSIQQLCAQALDREAMQKRPHSHLEDHCAAAGNGRGQLPSSHQQGEVLRQQRRKPGQELLHVSLPTRSRTTARECIGKIRNCSLNCILIYEAVQSVHTMGRWRRTRSVTQKSKCSRSHYCSPL